MKSIHTAVLAALLALPVAAVAHGDEAHTNKKAGPVKKEQKDWGIAGDAKNVKRTIDIKMLDNMRFAPSAITVRQGDTVRLLMTNIDQVQHELVLGSRKELDEHAALMAKFPNMEHDEPYMAHVAPGNTGVLVWTFNRAGEFDFACLIAGQYQAGMIGTIKVAAK